MSDTRAREDQQVAQAPPVNKEAAAARRLAYASEERARCERQYDVAEESFVQAFSRRDTCLTIREAARMEHDRALSDLQKETR